jgi:uncharacterized repeat protein (TIGR01451 family)
MIKKRTTMKQATTSHRPPSARASQLLFALFAAMLITLVSSANASAAPAWGIHVIWGDTNLQPGGRGEFLIVPQNYGTTAATEPVEIVDQLPPGVKVNDISSAGPDELASFCSGIGSETLSCEFANPEKISEPLSYGPESQGGTTSPGPNTGFMSTIIVDVVVSPTAAGTGVNTATISGGGAPQVATDTDEIAFGGALPEFGIVPGGFEGEVYDDEMPFGSPLRQAGDHPYELRVNFDFNHRYGVSPLASGGAGVGNVPYIEPVGRGRTVAVTLPRGMIGNPEAIPKCPQDQFSSVGSSGNATQCPANTQVGYLNIDFFNTKDQHGYAIFGPSSLSHVAIYNVEPPRGQVVDFGFNAGGNVQGHIYATLDAANDYAIKTLTPHISDLLAVRAVQVTVWGVPGDPRHDRYRYYKGPLQSSPALGAPFGNAPIRPLLTMPSDCGVDNGASVIEADSWTAPGAFTPPVESPSHVNVQGCEDPRIRFKPSIAMQPTSRAAGGPTGLAVHLESPQRDLTVGDADDLYAKNGSVLGISTPPVKKVVVTMPEGMTLSPSAAQGLGSCSLAQIGLGTNDPVTCPDSSQYGTLTLHTPLLPPDKPMKGFIYIAKQKENPSGEFLAMYMVIQEPDRGLLVKIPARVQLDQATGQITVTFDNLPQFPVADMELSFKGGVRAALVNPATCGTKTIRAEFFSWHDSSRSYVVDNSYPIAQKPDGSPCLGTLGERPFAPQLEAGTLSNSAGSYSPFVFRLQRSDEDQEFSQLGVTLPDGLLAKISGIERCSELGIAQASAPLRTGTQEVDSPSCPSSSLIGTTQVGTGVGVPLTYVPGKAYLAGPYQGAPLSMVVVSPAIVGPYDLGVIAVRSAIRIDPNTAQVSVQTDPFPQIFQGIPVRIRDIRVDVNRPQTMLNPTSCDPMQVSAEVTGTGGDLRSTADDPVASLRSRFQASNCARLGFRPKLRLRLKGGMERSQYPALTAVLTPRPGDANLGRTVVTLPHAEFLAQNHIRTICTRPQFAAERCPPGSVYGTASALSPLFDKPLQGKVYLRSSNHALPDIVAALRSSEGIAVNVSGKVDSKNGGIRTTFSSVPDAPVTRFVLKMKGGQRGLLENSRNLCRQPVRAEVRMAGQNNKTLLAKPLVSTDCRKRSLTGSG